MEARRYGRRVGLCSWLRERCVVNRRTDRDGDVGLIVPGEALADEEQSLLRRVHAVEDFVTLASRLVFVEDLKWAYISAGYQLLAINVALRRQLESIDAACLLCRNGLCHLAITLVRPSIEDIIYLDLFRSLKMAESQELSLLMSSGINYGRCSLNATTSVTRTSRSSGTRRD